MHQKVRLYIWILLYQAVNHGSALYHFHLLTVGQIDCNLAPKKILKFQNPYKFPIGDSECGLIFEKISKSLQIPNRRLGMWSYYFVTSLSSQFPE